MNKYKLFFHHIGMATRNPNEKMLFLKNSGYRFLPKVYDPVQKVHLIMCNHDYSPAIELVSPSSEVGPVCNILKNESEKIYHLCYTTPNIDESVALLKNDYKIICVSPPKPAILFKNKLVSFYFIKGLGLIELLENEELNHSL